MTDAERLARAVLMFHSASAWTPEASATWKALTGSDNASTRTLCDMARDVLVNAGADLNRSQP